MSRFLRPAHLLGSGDAVWLVDESWPVAAALDADGNAAVVDWPASETATYTEPSRVAVADGVGIVVQDGEQVAWVRRAGSVVHGVGRGLTLSAADPEAAWLVDRSFVDPGRPDPGATPEAPPLSTGRIVALRRDGSRTTVTTTAPPVPGEGAGPAKDTATGWGWLETDPQIVRRYGVAAGGALWWAGAPTGGDRIDRRVIAVSHDPTTAQEVLRIDLGLGLVGAARTVGDELWLAVVRRRYLSFAPRDGGVDVLAVSPTGAVRTVYRADSIDITSSAPPLRRPTDQQIGEHAHHVRDMFAHLEDFWHAEDGTTRALSDGHADVFLMEDLDTNYLAPADEAVDGVLDT